MRGKKCVLMLTLTFLLGAIIASVPPVKPESYETRLFVRESPPGSWIDGSSVSTYFYVKIDIESPWAWDDNSTGIVGWELSVHVDPSVLEIWASGAYSASLGYFMFDYLDWHGYTDQSMQFLIDEINKTSGDIYRAGEVMLGYGLLGKGAGGNSGPGWYGETYGLIQLRFHKLSNTAYSRIDIYNAFWVDTNGTKHAFDVVDDGHFNEPPFTYLHSQSSLIDLSSPVTSSWHELYPTYSRISSLNDWVDTGGDGVLSPSDFILLNDTWYHVEEVTVTIETKTAYGEAGSSTNSPSSTSGGWTTGDGAYADGGGSASIDSGKPSASQYYSGYGFNIPTAATITQVRVRLDAWTGGNEEIHLQVSENGGSTWLASTWFTALTASETTYWADVTGWTSWTPAKINSDNIQTEVWAQTVGGGNPVYLDWIPIEVTYIAPLPMYLEYLGGFNFMDETIANPNGTIWHEVYPVFSNIYNLTGLIDSDASGNITVSDYIELKNATGDTTTYHVDDIDTDIIISGPIAEPPEFPLGLALEISLIAAIAYVWWRSRRKTKITKQTKLAY